jgi:hypothetical protein
MINKDNIESYILYYEALKIKLIFLKSKKTIDKTLVEISKIKMEIDKYVNRIQA